MINEIYLPLHEAAEITKSKNRALLQHGFEKGLPIYAQVQSYGYFNILYRETNSAGIEIKNEIIGDDRFPEFLENPLNGRFLVQRECLDSCARDPENAVIFFEYRQVEPDASVKRHIFCGLKYYLRDAQLEVMVSDLIDADLLQNNNMKKLNEFVADPRWPEELDFAIMAWHEALSTHNLNDKPREFIEKWLRDQHKDNNNTEKRFTNEQVQRMTTIANWNKSPGRKPSTTS